MASILKVDTIQDQDGNNIINENANVITVGASGDTVNIVGTLQNNGAAIPGDISSVVAGTGLSGGGTSGDVTLNIEAAQPTITSTGTLTNFTSTGIDDNATSTAITIDSSENVGIGTTSPDNILMVSSDGNSASAQPLSIVNPSRYGASDSVELEFGMGRANDTNNLNFPIIGLQKEQQWQGASTNVDASVIFKSVSNQTASEAMRITSSGNVGIGTSSPTEVLHVVGDILATGGDFKSDANNYLGFSNNTFARFVINDSEKMRIDSSGNLGIGTSSPTARLSVADSKTGTEASPHLVIVGDGYTGNHWLDTSAYYIGQNSNARLLRIYSGSNEAVGVELGVGATSFGTYSDERLKKDITDLTNGLNKILALRPVNFKYKSDADDYRNRIGIIAQSIVGQVDEALDETKITADDETQYYNVRYQDLIPVLVKGIQEQQTQIQELEAKITALETNQP
jgi:hypothetical protein